MNNIWSDHSESIHFATRMSLVILHLVVEGGGDHHPSHPTQESLINLL